MKAYFFHAFICLLFVFALLFVGFSLCLIPIAPDWIYYLTNKLKNQPEFFLKIGQVLVAVGLLFLTLFYFLNKKTFYSVVVTPSLSYSLQNKVIYKIVSSFFEKERPKEKVPFSLNIYGQNIELTADLSKISFQEHEAILMSLEDKLGKLIEKKIGSPNKLTVNVLAKKD